MKSQDNIKINNCLEEESKPLMQVKILSEALHYLQDFAGETFVIKYGGFSTTDKTLSKSFASDIVLLKQIGINPVIVHGGGKKINEVLSKLNIKSNFINGLRVTDAETMEVVEMVLSGLINKDITRSINDAGGSAIGISGKDCNLVEARKMRCTHTETAINNIERLLDMGCTGEPHVINPEILFFLEESEIIPIISPVCYGENNATYNVNADSVASAIAVSLSASKLILLTDTPGILDKEHNVISKINTKNAYKLIEENVITGGMIPKVKNSIKMVREGCGFAHILDGRVPHILLLSLFTANSPGTTIMDSD